MFSYQVPQSSLCHENVPFVSGRISKVDYLFSVWQYIKPEVLLSTLQTAALTLHPSLVRARVICTSRGADLSEVVYPGNLMTLSQDAPLINSNTCSRLNLIVYGKPQMPATGKCISKIQCVYGTAAAEGWRESTHATRLQCIVLREADTHKTPRHTECAVGCLERRAGKKERKSEHIGVSIERNENVLEMRHGDNTLLCE